MVLVIDRGYKNYDWHRQLSRQGVFFVTRLKNGAAFTEVSAKARSAVQDKFLSDRVITFDKLEPDENSQEAEFRIIKTWIDGESGSNDAGGRQNNRRESNEPKRAVRNN